MTLLASVFAHNKMLLKTNKGAYTNAPPHHPHIILGSLQLVFWIFFHPSAWRNHIASIAPNLPPDFSLITLHQNQWRNPDLRRLLVHLYLVWPCLIALLLFLILTVISIWGDSSLNYLLAWLSGEPNAYVIYNPFDMVVIGVAFGLGINIIVSLTIGLTTSVSTGVAAGVVGGGIAGVAHGIVGGIEPAIIFGVGRDAEVGVGMGLVTLAKQNQPLALLAGLLIIISLALALGITGNVAGTITSEQEGASYTFMQQLGGVIGSIFFSGVSLSFGVASAKALSDLVAQATALNFVANVTYGIILGVSLGVPFGFVIGQYTRQWLRSLIFGSFIGVFVGFMQGVMVNIMLHTTQIPWGVGRGLLLGVTSGIINGGMISSLYVVAYLSTRRIVGTWASAVIGPLGSAGVFIVFSSYARRSVIGGDPLWPLVPVGLFTIFLGLTISWWRPILLYPFLAIWHRLIFQVDMQRRPNELSLLPWHAAFWDEHQLLPWFTLKDHVLLLASHNPEAGSTAIAYLATSRQRRIARQVQIELDARYLERCVDIESIGQAYHNLPIDNVLAGSFSILLRSFSRLSQDVEVALHQRSTYHQRLALKVLEENAEQLSHELIRSQEAYASRFHPITRQWYQIIVDYQRELVEAIEVRQEIESPYILGVPLTEQQEIFVGRTDISADIERLLLDKRRIPLFLYGQRRMGKTSLLNNLGRLLPTSIIPLFVDLQGTIAGAKDETGFLYGIARSMTKAARQKRTLNLPPLSRELLAVDPFIYFDAWLDQVEQILNEGSQKTILLALDEFETLETAISKGRLDETLILGMLRHIIQHRSGFKILLAGSHTLDELKRWANYLINVQVVHISYLNPDEARQLIEAPIKDFPLQYETEASQHIFNLTRGHPFLIQQMCEEIVALKNEQTPALRRLVCLADVEAAIPKVFEHGSLFFNNIEYHEITPPMADLLRFIAAQGDGAIVSEEILAQHIENPATLQEMLSLLTRRELIERVEGRYRFEVTLIRRWFGGI